MLLFLPCLCALTSKSSYACLSYSKECGHPQEKLKGNSYSSSAAVGSRGLGLCLIHVCIASFQEEHHLLPFKSPCSH